jgi:hypothetical protein
MDHDILHEQITYYRASMETFRKYGSDPFRVVVIHGGPGAVGSVGPLMGYSATGR